MSNALRIPSPVYSKIRCEETEQCKKEEYSTWNMNTGKLACKTQNLNKMNRCVNCLKRCLDFVKIPLKYLM